MFFSYALLLFLLGTSVNATQAKCNDYFSCVSQTVKIPGSDMAKIGKGPTTWYRLELPKDHQVSKIFLLLNQVSVYLTYYRRVTTSIVMMLSKSSRTDLYNFGF